MGASARPNRFGISLFKAQGSGDVGRIFMIISQPAAVGSWEQKIRDLSLGRPLWNAYWDVDANLGLVPASQGAVPFVEWELSAEESPFFLGKGNFQHRAETTF